MKSFLEFCKNRVLENYGGSANDPSNVEDEGDGVEGVEKRLEKPGAFPTFGDDLPITKKSMKKKCRCK